MIHANTTSELLQVVSESACKKMAKLGDRNRFNIKQRNKFVIEHILNNISPAYNIDTEEDLDSYVTDYFYRHRIQTIDVITAVNTLLKETEVYEGVGIAIRKEKHLYMISLCPKASHGGFVSYFRILRCLGITPMWEIIPTY